MDRLEALKQAALDPRLSQPEREAAQDALASLTETAPQREACEARGQLETELFRFASVARLQDVPEDLMIRFADAQPQTEALNDLCDLWRLMRTLEGMSPARRLWASIGEKFADLDERRREFERITARYPFLAMPLVTEEAWRDDVKHLTDLCALRSAYDVRTYFIPRVRERLQSLPEFAFAAREMQRACCENMKEKANEHRRT